MKTKKKNPIIFSYDNLRRWIYKNFLKYHNLQPAKGELLAIGRKNLTEWILLEDIITFFNMTKASASEWNRDPRDALRVVLLFFINKFKELQKLNKVQLESKWYDLMIVNPPLLLEILYASPWYRDSVEFGREPFNKVHHWWVTHDQKNMSINFAPSIRREKSIENKWRFGIR